MILRPLVSTPRRYLAFRVACILAGIVIGTLLLPVLR